MSIESQINKPPAEMILPPIPNTILKSVLNEALLKLSMANVHLNNVTNENLKSESAANANLENALSEALGWISLAIGNLQIFLNGARRSDPIATAKHSLNLALNEISSAIVNLLLILNEKQVLGKEALNVALQLLSSANGDLQPFVNLYQVNASGSMANHDQRILESSNIFQIRASEMAMTHQKQIMGSGDLFQLPKPSLEPALPPNMLQPPSMSQMVHVPRLREEPPLQPKPEPETVYDRDEDGTHDDHPEKIIDHRRKGKGFLFHVKYKGPDIPNNYEWKSTTKLRITCPKLLASYLDSTEF